MNLSCVVIGPDRELASQLLVAFEELGGIAIARDFHQYPQDHEALRMVRSLAPKLICLGLSDQARSFALIDLLQNEFPGIQIAVFHNSVEPQLLLKLMQHGIREYIAPPFDPDQLAEVLIRLRDAALKNPISSPTTNLVYSFLPSKPGSGTTTLAINTSVAMSKMPEANTLLMDLDLNSGLVRFLLKLDNDFTILDAAQHAPAMDEALWPQIVCPVGNLDVIHTARITPGVRVESSHARALIDYARKQYKAICVDLSGNMERYSMEVMQESKTVFLVCTPEIPSLHLAREKFQFLKAEGLDEKVKFLLNRHTKTDLLQIEQIQNLLGAPVALTFANDYRGVSQAVADGKEINPNSELGKQITAFAYQLLERPVPSLDGKSKKKEIRGFSELFKFGASRVAQLSDSESKA
jgi:pilus assembly protein CpaE